MGSKSQKSVCSELDIKRIGVSKVVAWLIKEFMVDVETYYNERQIPNNIGPEELW